MQKPKPLRKDRNAEKQLEVTALKAYRSVNVALAIERDNNQCVFCYFLHGMSAPRQEVHHVYSRGKKAGSFREHYTSLLCTCKECHPLPIQTPGASGSLAWVEAVLRKANETPINKKFQHQEKKSEPV
jgi:hypothetical protein